MKTLLGCLAAVVIALLLLVALGALMGIPAYNRLVHLSQGVDAQWAQVQNVYQRRADLIPNLVSTVQGAADFEKSTLTEVTQARASVGRVMLNPNTAPSDPAQLAQYEESQRALSGALARLLVVAERYPDLKSNANFQGLQSQLEGSENRITVERARFNESVRAYNAALKTFPTVFFAPMLGFLPKPYFAAAKGAEVPPQVEFDFKKDNEKKEATRPHEPGAPPLPSPTP